MPSSGILIYRELPDALTRIEILTARLKYGFTVIPIPLAAIEDAIGNASSCAAILDAYRERYLPGADLFAEHNAISNAFAFFGRRTLLERIETTLRRNRSVGLFGLRKSGESSVLHQLRLTMRHHPVVHINLLVHSGQDRFGCAVYNAVLGRLTSLLDGVTDEAMFFDVNDSATVATREFIDQFVSIARRLEEKGFSLPIICLLDEMERILPTDTNRPNKGTEFNAVLSTLRALSQSHRLVAMVATDVHPDYNRANYWPTATAESNPICGFFTEVFLQPFVQEETATMIRDIAGLMDRELDDETIDNIQVLSGGHPYLSRQLASMLAAEYLGARARRIDTTHSARYVAEPLRLTPASKRVCGK